MSIRIKVSYENPRELSFVLHKLGQSVVKVQREPPKGKYRRAYIDIEPPDQSAEKREKSL